MKKKRLIMEGILKEGFKFILNKSNINEDSKQMLKHYGKVEISIAYGTYLLIFQ